MGSTFAGITRTCLRLLALGVVGIWAVGCASDDQGGNVVAGSGATPRPVPFVDELRIGDLVKVMSRESDAADGSGGADQGRR